MTIQHFLHDAGHCLRVASPPVLVLGLLTAVRTVEPPLMSEGVLGIAWQAATVASTASLVVALAVAAVRPRRDRRARERLEHLRDLAAEPNRALVHVQTTIWSTAAGQHAVVVNIATGILYRVWLQTTWLPTGGFAVLEQRGGAVFVVDWMDACSVQAAQRHLCRSVGAREVEQPRKEAPPVTALAEDALQLIAETENYLRNHSQL